MAKTAELKTKPSRQSVSAFVSAVEDVQRRKDCSELLALMKEVTGERPTMWGDSIVGFGTYHYKYESGREGDWFVTGFSPRKRDLSIYIIPGFAPYESLMQELGKFRLGKSCLYVKKLDDLDRPTLRKLVARSVADMGRKYG